MSHIDADQFVQYNASTDMSTCRMPDCDRVLSSRNMVTIKRHYLLVHKIDIEERHKQKQNKKQNLRCIARKKHIKRNIKRSSLNLDKYVRYDEELDKASCLVPLCGRTLNGRNPFNIHRHYLNIHKIDIKNCAGKSEERLNDQTTDPFNVVMEEDSHFNIKRSSVNLDKYVRYDEELDKASCLMPLCGSTLTGKNLYNIHRHYFHVHKIDIKKRGGKCEKIPTNIASNDLNTEIQDDLNTTDPLNVMMKEEISISDGNSLSSIEEFSNITDVPSTRQEEEETSYRMAKLDEKIGFIGGGNMAYAIGAGLINRGIIKSGQVLVSGPNMDNLMRWQKLGVSATEDNCEVLEKSDIIFICVKPHILTPCADHLRNAHRPAVKDKDKLFVSVLAGISLKTLEEKFSFMDSLKMIRTMPNTSMQVGEGCTVYTAGTYVEQKDLEKVHLMLNAVGIAQQVPESMINAVSGVSGCGPAYVYTVIEALADGGVKQGVPRQMALQFAAQTVLGAAKTVLMTKKHPAELRDEVCSPGGATIVGVHEIEKGNMRATLINAVEKSSQRAAELGK